MQSKFLIGFDMDGVLIDHARNKIEVSQKFGYTLDILETPSDVMKTKIPEQEYDQIQEVLFDNMEIGLKPGLTSGVLDVLKQVQNMGIPFVLISRRKRTRVAEEYLKISPLNQFFNTSNTFFVKTKEEKNKKAIELGVQLYIDDQPSVLEKMPAVDHRVLFDPFKVFESWEKTSGCSRISAWQEFLPLALARLNL